MELKAFVDPAISISSDWVTLRGTRGKTVSYVVELKAELPKPLVIEPLSFDLGGKVLYSIETIEKGRSYRIHFENDPSLQGSFSGMLRLKTNYEERPQILIRIRGRF